MSCFLGLDFKKNMSDVDLGLSDFISEEFREGYGGI